MRSNRTILIRILGLGLALPFLPACQTDDAPYPAVGVEVTAQQVADTDSYFVEGLTGVPDAENEGFMSNAGFVITDEGVVVYDALGTPSLGYELLLRIRELTDEPVRYVVVGHYHADHIYGLQAFDEHTDATVIAQADHERYFEGDNAERRLAQRRDALSPWVDENTRIVRPDETFGDSRTLRLGDHTIQLMHAGPAHAPDDVIMMVENSGVVFAGDLIFDERIPFAGDEHLDSANWLARLEEVQAMEPEFVVPGHGPPAPDAQDAIEFTRDYLHYVRENMREGVADFMTFEETYAATDWSEYEDLPAFEEANRRNANSIYLEMEAKGM